MSEILNSDYYRRREAAERALALCSIEPKIARIHLDMANMYAEKVVEFTPRRVLGLVV